MDGWSEVQNILLNPSASMRDTHKSNLYQYIDLYNLCEYIM